MKPFALLSIVFMASVVATPAHGSGVREKPNIIFILADDLGWGDVGYNGSAVSTPNIDSMATSSIKLERHYVHPYCLPTRLALFTGDYPGRTSNNKPVSTASGNLPQKSLPQELSDAGYETFISGKWHLGSDKPRGPLTYGFSQSYGVFNAHADPYFHDTAEGRHVWHRNDEELEEEGHATDLLTDEAIRIIKAPHENPYFLYLAYTAPHWPLDAPQRWKDFYAQKNIKNPLYAAMVSHLDENLGRVFSQVQNHDNTRDTIIIFASDNGAEARSEYTDNVYSGVYGERYDLQIAFGSNAPLRGAKGTVYEGGIRVPSFVWWSGLTQAHTVTTPLQIEDWFPTLLNLSGSSTSYEGPGMDIFNILTGTQSGNWDREFYTRSSWPYPMWSLRDGPTKLIVSLTQKNLWLQSALKVILPKSQEWRISQWFGNADTTDPSRLRFEFYNVQTDPAERNNLSHTLSRTQKQVFLDRLNKYRSLDTTLNNELCLPTLP